MTKLRLIACMTLATAALSLGACGTLNGMGQDIEDGGEAIQDAAN